MIKNIKKLSLLFSLAILFSLVTTTSYAHYMELTDVVGNIEVGTYYTQTINFHSDTGTDNLNGFYLSLGYDNTKVGLYGIAYQDYDDGDPMVPQTVWDGGKHGFTDLELDGMVYNINGSEPGGQQGNYLPAAGDTLLATIYWSPLVTEDNVTVSTWIDGISDDFYRVDLVQYWDPDDANPYAQTFYHEYRDFVANTDGLEPAAVPIPGAIFLLVPAFLGLIGLRRKKA